MDTRTRLVDPAAWCLLERGQSQNDGQNKIFHFIPRTVLNLDMAASANVSVVVAGGINIDRTIMVNRLPVKGSVH